MTAREHAEEAAVQLTEGRPSVAQVHALIAIALALTNHPGLAEEEA